MPKRTRGCRAGASVRAARLRRQLERKYVLCEPQMAASAPVEVYNGRQITYTCPTEEYVYVSPPTPAPTKIYDGKQITYTCPAEECVYVPPPALAVVLPDHLNNMKTGQYNFKSPQAPTFHFGVPREHSLTPRVRFPVELGLDDIW